MNRELNQFDRFSFLLSYYGPWQFRKMYRKVTGNKLRSRHYAGKRVIEPNSGNDYLIRLIEKNEPFMAGRLGGTEIFAMAEILRSECLHKDYDMNRLNQLNILSGFTEKDNESYWKFNHIMLEAVKNCDLMGVWYNQMEDWVCKKYMNKKSILTHRITYDFWNWDTPFTSALKGKKVLVIHPFSETIESQYAKREKLFKNPDVLPEFELVTVMAVQTLANQADERFSSWFEALDYMYEEAIKKDFDIALIACGAYGFPLAARLKEAGRSAIHMGGVLQVLFGIKGKRWDNIPEVVKLYNEYWVRPSQEEKFIGAEGIEGGCYW